MSPDRVFVSGNTVIDALLFVASMDAQLDSKLVQWLEGFERMVLLTVHRRESFGEPMQQIFSGVKKLAAAHARTAFVYPVHPNPNVRQVAHDAFTDVANVRLIEPLDYLRFVKLMQKSYLVMTDSGGVQEEAPSLGKPVVVLRQTSERPEGIEAGSAILAGDNADKIFANVNQLLSDEKEYARMSEVRNPYGDGNAAKCILEKLVQLS